MIDREVNKKGGFTMKKLICALLILMSLTTTALADEILFRGIPWQSTPLEFASALEKEGTYFDDINAWSASSDFVEIESSYFDIPKWSVSDVPIYELERFNGEKKTVCVVAGYDVERVIAYFLPVYNDGVMNTQDMENAQLYKARYLIKNFPSGMTVDSAYDDLLIRLNELYGEGTDASGEVCERACHWSGENGTSVSLYRGSSVAVYGIYIPASLSIEYQCSVDETYITDLVDTYNATMNTNGGL